MRKLALVWRLLGFSLLLSGCAENAVPPSPDPANPFCNQLYVGSTGEAFQTFGLTAEGNVASLQAFGTPKTGLLYPQAIAVDTVNDEIIVFNQTPSIAIYDRASGGNFPPKRTITGTELAALTQPGQLALDTTNNEIFVIGLDGTVLVYSRTADGPTAALRTLSTGGNAGIAVDPTTNLLFVSLMSGIAVYNRTDTGVTAPITTIDGGSSLITSPGALAVDTKNAEIWVIDQAQSARAFNQSDTGGTDAKRTISGNNLQLITVDSANNELWGYNPTTKTLSAFSRTANGAVSAIRSISGSITGFDSNGIDALFVDSVNSEIYGVGQTISHVYVFGRTASGNVAPSRLIRDTMNSNHAFAVDTVNNEVFVGNFVMNEIAVYPLETTGDNPTPSRTLVGATTGLDLPYALAIDHTNDELIVYHASNSAPKISVYPRAASGDTAPLRTISGVSGSINSVAVDGAHDEIFTIDSTAAKLRVYSRTATGSASPVRTLEGASTTLSTPASVNLDAVNDNLIVANVGGASILTFARTASGNTSPIYTIAGSGTGLVTPMDVVFDAVNDMLLVLDTGSASLSAFPRTTSGAVAPSRTLSGAATGLTANAFKLGANACQ